jgi:tetratricopeptide (TPR) repeat protein
LEVFHAVRAELQKAWDLAEHLLALAQHHSDPALLDAAHLALGTVHYHLGAFAQAHTHLEQGMVIYDSQLEPSPAFLYAHGPKVVCASWSALTLWMLGYPDRALQRSHEAVTQARDLSHPFTLSLLLNWAAWLLQLRREPQAAATLAEAAMALSTEQGFAQWAAMGRVLRGWALAEQAQAEEGIADIRQGLTAYQATGAAVGRPHYLALLVEAYGRMGLVEAGLTALTEALMLVEKNGERVYQAELYRLTFPRRIIAGPFGRSRPRSGNLFSASLGRGAPPARQIARTAGCHEPQPPVATPGHACRSPAAASSGISLVYRRV